MSDLVGITGSSRAGFGDASSREALDQPASVAVTHHGPKPSKIGVCPMEELSWGYRTELQGGLSAPAHEAVAAPGRALLVWQVSDDQRRTNPFSFGCGVVKMPW